MGNEYVTPFDCVFHFVKLNGFISTATPDTPGVYVCVSVSDNVYYPKFGQMNLNVSHIYYVKSNT